MSLVASVAGIVLLPVIGSIAGIVFGHLGLKAVTNHTADNRGLALAGLIVGYVGLALMVLIIVVVMWLAATVMGGLGGSLYYGAGPLLVA
ncbi:MAG: DUF4190 domain-containing protein [Bifidobacteriaceae bacterium]|nr:DUF4190 domain-containing protein [Bifidobacteriaceae bacterium]